MILPKLTCTRGREAGSPALLTFTSSSSLSDAPMTNLEPVPPARLAETLRSDRQTSEQPIEKGTLSVA